MKPYHVLSLVGVFNIFASMFPILFPMFGAVICGCIGYSSYEYFSRR